MVYSPEAWMSVNMKNREEQRVMDRVQGTSILEVKETGGTGDTDKDSEQTAGLGIVDIIGDFDRAGWGCSMTRGRSLKETRKTSGQLS